MLSNHCLRTILMTGIMIALTFLVAGCWDRKEIENRGFVVGVAIDHTTTPEPKGQYDLSHVTQEAGGRKYRVTFELPKLQKAANEKETKTVDHYIFAGEGESLSMVCRAMNAKTNLSLFYEDIQIIVLSETVAREDIRGLLDFFERNPDMRRRAQVFVTPGRAEDILKSKISGTDVNSILIANTTRNVNYIPRFASRMGFDNIAEAIANNRSFFMPMIVLEGSEFKLTKLAQFNKDAKMVGIIDEWEIVGAKILRSVLKYGAFSIPNPSNPEKLVTFELLESYIQVNSHVKGDRLWFSLDAKFVGNIGENTQPNQEVKDPMFQSAVEQAVAEEFTRQVQGAYHKLQEMKVEDVDLGSLVHRQHPGYWKKVKDSWEDEVFPSIPLDVNIKVVVRRTGMTL